MSPFLSIDEEGYFLSNGFRWTDQELGRSVLQSLSRKEGGAFEVSIGGRKHIIESFDEPLVARSANVIGSSLEVAFPYGLTSTLRPQSLSCDFFDRFHGLTADGLPFVLSRSAQAQVFEQADEFSDDSLTLNGQPLSVGPWLIEAQSSRGPDSNENIELHPALLARMPQLKLPRSRIAVFADRSGQTAAFFSAAGHLVTTFESMNVVQEAQHGQFDLVFDQNLFARVSPSQRPQLVNLWHQLLSPSGFMLGIFFVVEHRRGPPWGASEWELRERTKSRFQPLHWNRVRTGPENKLGCELLTLLRKI
jgi:hypothetical protein